MVAVTSPLTVPTTAPVAPSVTHSVPHSAPITYHLRAPSSRCSTISVLSTSHHLGAPLPSRSVSCHLRPSTHLQSVPHLVPQSPFHRNTSIVLGLPGARQPWRSAPTIHSCYSAIPLRRSLQQPVTPAFHSLPLRRPNVPTSAALSTQALRRPTSPSQGYSARS